MLTFNWLRRAGKCSSDEEEEVRHANLINGRLKDTGCKRQGAKG